MDMHHTVFSLGTHPVFPNTLLEILFTIKSRLSATLYPNNHNIGIKLQTFTRVFLNEFTEANFGIEHIKDSHYDFPSAHH